MEQRSRKAVPSPGNKELLSSEVPGSQLNCSESEKLRTCLIIVCPPALEREESFGWEHGAAGLNQLLIPSKKPLGFQGLMVPPILDWEETLPCACPGGAGWEHMDGEGCRRMRRDGEG